MQMMDNLITKANKFRIYYGFVSRVITTSDCQCGFLAVTESETVYVAEKNQNTNFRLSFRKRNEAQAEFQLSIKF